MKNLIYSLMVGFILLLLMSSLSMYFEVLDSDLGVIIIFITTLIAVIYLISTKPFEKASLKDFLLSLILIIAILFSGSFVFALIKEVPIDGEAVQSFMSYLMPVAMLIGMYSFFKSSYNRLTVNEIEAKVQKCPCCKERVSLGYFVWKMLGGMEFISINENSKGIVCSKCNEEILNAKEKGELKMFPFFISIMPLMLFGFFVSMIFMLILSFLLYIVLISGKYYKVNFKCINLNDT